MNIRVAIPTLACFLVTLAAHASITVLPGGDNQNARQGATTLNPIRVLVSDAAGNPVPDFWVTALTRDRNACCISPSFDPLTLREILLFARTDSLGVADFGRVAGAYFAGPARFGVDASQYGTTTFVVHVTDDPPPAAVVALAPLPPALTSGAPAPDLLRVKVVDTNGAAIPRALVHYELSLTNTQDTYPAAGSFDGATIVELVAGEDGVVTPPPFTLAIARRPSFAAVAARPHGAVDIFPLPYAPDNYLRFPAVNLRYEFDVATDPARPSTLQDLWWAGPEETGWGVSIIEHPNDSPGLNANLFVVLFVYDNAGEPSWYVMPAGFWHSGRSQYGTMWFGELYKATGAPFHRYDPSQLVLGASVGNAGLRFSGDSDVRLEYQIVPDDMSVSAAVTGTKRLKRLDFSGGPVSPRQKVDDLWWGGATQNGWGIAIHEQPGAIFSLWLTYDDSRQPRWFVMPQGAWTDPDTYGGPLFKPLGPRWFGVPYDASRHRVEQVGSFQLRFAPGTPPQSATFGYSVGNRNGIENLTRVPF
jgi:hypothetical protein